MCSKKRLELAAWSRQFDEEENANQDGEPCGHKDVPILPLSIKAFSRWQATSGLLAWSQAHSLLEHLLLEAASYLVDEAFEEDEDGEDDDDLGMNFTLN